MSRGMEHDLSMDLQQSIGAVVERKIRVAQQVLEPADLTLMLVQASVALIMTTAATSAASVDDPAKVDDFFDLMLDSIVKLARSDRDRSLRKVRERRAEAGAA